MNSTEALEVLEIEYLHCHIRTSVLEAAMSAIEHCQFAYTYGLNERQREMMHEAYNIGKALHEHIASLPDLETETLEALAELQTAIDSVRDLL